MRKPREAPARREAPGKTMAPAVPLATKRHRQEDGAQQERPEPERVLEAKAGPVHQATFSCAAEAGGGCEGFLGGADHLADRLGMALGFGLEAALRGRT